MNAEQKLSPLRSREIRPGLERIRALLRAFDSSPEILPAVLIAGTNGKGSTASALESMARAAGYRTGLFTSPRFSRLEDQFLIEGEPLATDELTALAGEILRVDEEKHVGITYFEALTALACLAFARHGVELAILEVGMGGKDDAVNIADPLASLVTTVGLDHAEHLGGSLEAIAEHKAGIFRRHRPALIGWIDDPARTVLERRAAAIGARLLSAPDLIDGPWTVARETGQRVGFHTAAGRYEVDTAQSGPHQAHNLAQAVLAAEALRDAGFARLDKAAIARGALAWRWPGRLEWLVVAGRRVLLDAAHNVDGARALALYLRQLGTSFDLLFGTFADKDAYSMLAHLTPYVEGGVLTCPGDAQRSWSPRAFVAENSWWARLEIVPDDRAALEAALALSGGENARPLLICGSVRLVGDLRGRLDAPDGGSAVAARDRQR